MRRCLIVANQTLTSEALSRTVMERIGTELYEFYLVAPATPPGDLIEGSGPPPGAPSSDELGFGLARQRLDRAIEELQALEVTVHGEVGDADPVEAVREALGRFAADEIVVSTLHHTLSQWLRRDVPARLRRACDVPVTHVMAEA